MNPLIGAISMNIYFYWNYSVWREQRRIGGRGVDIYFFPAAYKNNGVPKISKTKKTWRFANIYCNLLFNHKDKICNALEAKKYYIYRNFELL